MKNLIKLGLLRQSRASKRALPGSWPLEDRSRCPYYVAKETSDAYENAEELEAEGAILESVKRDILGHLEKAWTLLETFYPEGVEQAIKDAENKQ